MSQLTFEQAVDRVRNEPPPRPFTNNEKLHMYGLFKQATVGDAPAAPPGFWAGWEAHAKWEVWSKFRGTPTTTAKRAYVATYTNLLQP